MSPLENLRDGYVQWIGYHEICMIHGLIFSTHQIGVHVMISYHTCMIRTRHLIGGMIDGLYKSLNGGLSRSFTLLNKWNQQKQINKLNKNKAWS